MSITLGSETTIGRNTSDQELSLDVCDNQASGSVVVGWLNSANFDAQICTVSGTTITAGSATQLDSANGQTHLVAGLDSGSFATAFRHPNTSPTGITSAGTISGTTITHGSFVQFHSDPSTFFAISGLTSTSWLIAYTKQTSSSNNYVVHCSRSGTTTTVNSEDQFATNATRRSIDALDSTNFVIAYQDANSSNEGKAVIGTVSGTTPSVTNDGGTTFDGTDDADRISVAAMSSTSFVVCYHNATDSDVKIVGATVSGTTITWGTPATISLNGADDVSVCSLDSTNWVACWTDTSDSSQLKAVQGSLSGAAVTVDGATQVDVSTGGASAEVNSRLVVPLGSAKVFFAWTDAASGAAASKGRVADVTTSAGPASVKTKDGIATASVKTVNGVAIASVKSINGIT